MTATIITIGFCMIAAATALSCALLSVGRAYDQSLGLDAEDQEEQP